MGAYLDLDDVIYGHPEAAKELKGLREERDQLRAEQAQYRLTEEQNFRMREWFKERTGLRDGFLGPQMNAIDEELDRLKAKNNRLRTALKNTALDRLYQAHGMDDAVAELKEEVGKNDRLKADLKRYKSLVHRALEHGCTRPWKTEAKTLLGTWNPYGFGDALEGGGDEAHR